MSEHLEVYLFSTLRIVSSGKTFALGAPRKAESLLANLLLNRGIALTRDAVAFALWPDEKEGSARANLRRHIHLLTRALPARNSEAPWILSGMKTVQWNPDAPAWVDVAAFEAEAQHDSPDQELLDLFTGDVLAEFDEDWLVPIRERLRNIYFEAVMRSIHAYRQTGRYDLAIRAAQKLLERDRWREDAVRELISARYGHGDRAGAMQEYWKFSIALQTELAVDPMPETLALYEAILDGADYSLLPSVVDAVTVGTPKSDRKRDASQPARLKVAEAEISGAMQPVRSRILVGRGGDIASLQGSLERAIASQKSQTVLIEGAAGFGKTRLISDFLASQNSKDVATAFSTCFRYTRAPLAPLGDVFKTLLELSPPAHRETSWLPKALEPLVLQSAPEAEDGGQRITDQRAQFSALTEALRHLSARGPIVIAIDDLHWADEATLECLCFLVPRLGSSAVLFLLSYRAEALDRRHPLLRALTVIKGCENVTERILQPLKDDEIKALATSVMGEASPADVVRRITLLAEGNPLFAEELIKHSLDARSIVDPQALPLTLKAAVLQRFDEFNDEERTLLTQAAVLGPAFGLSLLSSVADTSSEVAASVLRKARSMQLIVETDDEDAAFAFRHALLREILYGELLRDEARMLHKRAGEALEALGSPEGHAVELANHWTRAKDRARAVRYNELAGDEAMQLFAHRDAIRYYRRSQEFAEDFTRRGALLEKISDALINAGEFAEAQRCLGEALEVYERNPTSDRAAAVYLKLSVAAWGALQPQAALEWAQRAMTESEGNPTDPVHFAVLVRLARARIMRADPLGALGFLARAAEVEGPNTVTDLRLNRLTHQGLVNGMLGRSGDALRDFTAGEALLKNASDPAAIHVFHQNYAAVACWLGRTSLAFQQLDAAVRNGRRTFNPVLEAGALASSALIQVYAGDLLTARSLIDSAMRLVGPSPSFALLQVIGAGILIALRLEDDALLTELTARDALTAALQSGDATFTANITGAYIEYNIALGRLEAAKNLIHRQVEAAGCGANLLLCLVDAARHGDDADLDTIARRLEAWATPEFDAGKAFLAFFRAMVGERQGKKTAKRDAARAASLLGELEAPYYLAIALELAGKYDEAVAIHERMHNKRDAGRVERRRTTQRPARVGDPVR